MIRLYKQMWYKSSNIWILLPDMMSPCGNRLTWVEKLWNEASLEMYLKEVLLFLDWQSQRYGELDMTFWYIWLVCD